MPNNLWIVLAAIPVISPILLAALPVGAAKRNGGSSLNKAEDGISANFLKAIKIPLIIVVFPVPGPPVRIEIGLFNAFLIAVF